MARRARVSERRWSWQTVLSVGVILLLVVGALLAFLGVVLGGLEPAPSPEGTYPTGYHVGRIIRRSEEYLCPDAAGIRHVWVEDQQVG